MMILKRRANGEGDRRLFDGLRKAIDYRSSQSMCTE